MASRGMSELKRNFERDHPLGADQRYRKKSFLQTVLDKNDHVLHGEKLEDARGKYKNFDVPALDHKRLYHYDVVEGKPFAFTSESEKTGIQIHLLMTLLRSGGELCDLQEYWTQVGVLTGSSVSTSDFSWSPERISVIIIVSR